MSRRRPPSFVWAVLLAGLPAIAAAIAHARGPDPIGYCVVAACAVLAARLKVPLPLPEGASSLSVGGAVVFLALLLFGAPATVPIALAAAWAQCLFVPGVRTPPIRVAFSMVTLALAVLAAGLMLELLRSTAPSPFDFVALVGAASAYFFVNTGLIAGAVAAHHGRSVGVTWAEHYLMLAPSHFIGVLVAVGASHALAYPRGLLIAVALTIPVALTAATYRTYFSRLREGQQRAEAASALNVRIIEALTFAIGAPGTASPANVQVLQRAAREVAVRVGLDADEVRAVELAVLLRDIGMLAVPTIGADTSLDEEELAKIQTHPLVASDILSDTGLPESTLPAIAAHHERWDGQGYPRGLKGEQIPVAGRIVALIDAWSEHSDGDTTLDAIRFDVIEKLQDEAGHRLDPVLVPIFVDRLRESEPLKRKTDGAGRSPTMVTMRPETREDISSARREARAFYAIAQLATTNLPLEESLEAVVAQLGTLVPFTACAVHRFDEQDRLTCVLAHGPQANTLIAAAHPSAENVHALQTARGAGGAVRSSMVTPLTVGTRTVGMLAVSQDRAGGYHDDHARLLRRVGEQMARFLDTAGRFERAEQHAFTDQLTGLFNQRAFRSKAGRALERAASSGEPVSVLLTDLDGFKFVNDTYGHHAGDKVLIEVARRMETTVRANDVCARYAGDEFVVLLIGCDAPQADERRHELQDAIGDISVPWAKRAVLHVGLSAGRATFPRDGADLDQLLAVADKRMYANKARRKRRLAEVPAPGPVPVDINDPSRRNRA